MGDPATTALIIGSIAGPTLGGIMAGEGQQVSSFEGDEQVDPSQLLSTNKQQLNSFLKYALEDANRPARVDTTVAPLPQFAGGGLPMTIAAPALDPARRTPERRTLPGAGVSPEGFHTGEVGGYNPTAPGSGAISGTGSSDAGTYGLGFQPNAGGEAPMSSTMPVPGGGDLGTAPDLDQATGAVQLLLAQLQQQAGV